MSPQFNELLVDARVSEIKYNSKWMCSMFINVEFCHSYAINKFKWLWKFVCCTMHIHWMEMMMNVNLHWFAFWFALKFECFNLNVCACVFVFEQFMGIFIYSMLLQPKKNSFLVYSKSQDVYTFSIFHMKPLRRLHIVNMLC